MFGTQTLDVVIGMVFIFLALSLVVTAFNELVAAWLKRRPKNLWRGVVRLVGDEGFAKSVYAHPLISSLSQSSSLKPSYIPSRTFALAVLDVLTGSGAPPPANAREVTAALAKLPQERQGLATALTVMLHDAGDNMDEFKKGLEQWFDNSMERVSGWYKRQTQWMLLAMAAAVTIWANADTIALANKLWSDPAVRSALVTQAQQYVAQEGKESESAPAAQSKEGPPPPPAEPPSEAPEVDAESKLEKSMARIENLALPLGWKNADNKDDQRDAIPAWADLWPMIAKHGLGWLLTTLAISLGAPFWFDMLNKVVSIRASGKAPEESQKSPKEVPTPTEPGGKPAVS
ncbi:MAG: hypothetical protein LAO55_19690 [Acidobacteriia bacterium]|nr:hypothetical protein [Terriglobia bacterium]